MNLKAIYKYQVRDFVYLWGIYFFVIVALQVFAVLMLRMSGEESTGTFSGHEMGSIIAGFIAGCVCYKESFLMLVQNSISRKKMFIGRSLVIISNGVIFTAMNPLFMLSYKLLFFGDNRVEYVDVLRGIFPKFYSGVGEFGGFMISSLFWIFVVIAATMLGYFMGAFYYKISKVLRLTISIGLPVFLFILWPFVDTMLWGGRATGKVLTLFNTIMGVNAQNPFIGVATGIIATVILGGLSYLLLLKAQIKKD